MFPIFNPKRIKHLKKLFPNLVACKLYQWREGEAWNHYVGVVFFPTPLCAVQGVSAQKTEITQSQNFPTLKWI